MGFRALGAQEVRFLTIVLQYSSNIPQSHHRRARGLRSRGLGFWGLGSWGLNLCRGLRNYLYYFGAPYDCGYSRIYPEPYYSNLYIRPV